MFIKNKKITKSNQKRKDKSCSGRNNNQTIQPVCNSFFRRNKEKNHCFHNAQLLVHLNRLFIIYLDEPTVNTMNSSILYHINNIL